MAKSVDLKLNIKPVAKLKGLLNECVVSADRLGDAMSRINPEALAAYKDIGPDPLVSDMRTAVAICENEDHVTSMIGKSWLKALIQHRCSVVGMNDPFEDSKQRYDGGDAFTLDKVVLIDPIPEEDKGPVVTDTWGPWTHPFGGEAGELRQRSDAWLSVCALLDEVSPGWSESHKNGADAALAAIKGMSDPDFKEVPKPKVKNGRTMVAEGIGYFVMDEVAEAAFRMVFENLGKPAMVEALNKHFGISLPVPGEPVKELEPKKKLAGFQIKHPDGHWVFPVFGTAPAMYEKDGIPVRYVYADEE